MSKSVMTARQQKIADIIDRTGGITYVSTIRAIEKLFVDAAAVELAKWILKRHAKCNKRICYEWAEVELARKVLAGGDV